MALWKKNIKRIDGPDGFLIPKENPDTGEIDYILPENPHNSLFTKPIMINKVQQAETDYTDPKFKTTPTRNAGRYLYSLFNDNSDLYPTNDDDHIAYIHWRSYLNGPYRKINEITPFKKIKTDDNVPGIIDGKLDPNWKEKYLKTHKMFNNKFYTNSEYEKMYNKLYFSKP